jgi:hypothetical protein
MGQCWQAVDGSRFDACRYVPCYCIVAWDITCDCNMGNSDMLVLLAIVGEAPFTLLFG